MRTLNLTRNKYLNGVNTRMYDTNEIINQSVKDLSRRLHEQGDASVNGNTPKPNDSVEEPKRSDFSSNIDMLDQLMVSPISAEEEERRKRAASAVEGIGHLGNVMNAFSNLIHVRRGAPNQELPTVPTSDLDKFEDRVRDNRARYMQSRMMLENADKSEYQNAWDRWNAKQQQDLANERYNREWEYKLENDKKAQEIADRTYELQKKSQEQANSLAWAKFNEDKKLNDARILGGYYNRGTSSRGGSKSGDSITLKTPSGNFVDVDMNKLNESALEQYYREYIPEEVKKEYPIRSTMDKDARITQYKAALGYAIRNSEKAAEDLVKSGVGTLHQQEEAAQEQSQSQNEDNTPPSMRANAQKPDAVDADNVPPSMKVNANVMQQQSNDGSPIVEEETPEQATEHIDAYEQIANKRKQQLEEEANYYPNIKKKQIENHQNLIKEVESLQNEVNSLKPKFRTKEELEKWIIDNQLTTMQAANVRAMWHDEMMAYKEKQRELDRKRNALAKKEPLNISKNNEYLAKN